MARTLIGQLILRLQARGLKEADKVKAKLNEVERTADRLAKTPAPTWGVGFQKSLNQLKLTQTEMKAVETSWVNLHDKIKKKNLPGVLKSNEISHWKTQTLGDLATAKAEMDAHFSAIEKRAKVHGQRFRDAMKPVFVGLGFYTAAYGAGMAGAGALRAASERARTEYRLDLASIPEADQNAMRDKAQGLSAKYPSIDATEILELQKTTYALFGGNRDRALELIEPLIKSFIADVTAVGVQKAGENLSSFLKAMDNLNVNEGPDGGVSNIESILEGWVKAKQIEGKEIDIGDLLGFARRSKVAKYALSDDFLTDYLPALGQDMGFDALGDALSGAYQNFVTPSGGGVQGQYVKRQKAMGLRDANNSLVGRDLFASNPYQWTLEVLKPLLEQDGVDTSKTAAVSEAVKKLMSNSKAAAMITGWIEAQAQIEKNVALYKKAVGTGDVENARYKDPFAATEALLASLRNLSAAILPMEAIAAGLNTLADTVNNIAAAAEKNPGLTAGGLALGAYGTYKGGKWVFNKAADLFGLKSSALALDGAAAALTRAAVALGGKGTLGDVVTSGGKKTGGGGKGTVGLIGALLSKTPLTSAAVGATAFGMWAAGRSDPNAANKDLIKAVHQKRILYGEDDKNSGLDFTLGNFGGFRNDGRAPSAGGFLDAPVAFKRSDSYVAGLPEAMRGAKELEELLNIEATPSVNTQQIDAAIAKAEQLRSKLVQANAEADAVNSDLGAEMRRNFVD
ncbi:hypothetical protein [Roseibium alexandrii]|uniref:hypothetical protein n=1 Tax=Roseibium alexandrii TaxID=388408 RepID=UPI00375373EF